MNQKSFSRAVLIVFVIVLLATLGYVFLKKEKTSDTLSVGISPLTKSLVLSGFDQCGTQFNNGEFSIGFDKYTELERTCSAAVSMASLSQDNMVFADLDGDGVNEVLVPVRTVRASSGGGLYIFKNVDGVARVIDGVVWGKENGKIVSVNKDVVVVETDGTVENTSKKLTYKFVSGKLIKQ